MAEKQGMSTDALLLPQLVQQLTKLFVAVFARIQESNALMRVYTPGSPPHPLPQLTRPTIFDGELLSNKGPENSILVSIHT
jgi:hypothetical protein